MKKGIILYFIICSNVLLADRGKVIWEEPQSSVKSYFHMRDGQSFDKFERDLRKKYPGLGNIMLAEKITQIPLGELLEDTLPEEVQKVPFVNKFIQDNYMPYDQNISDGAYGRKSGIAITEEYALRGDPKAVEWTVLHEQGHALREVQAAKVIILGLAGSLWYSFRRPGFLLKKIAKAIPCSFAVLAYAMRREERLADDFANEHADLVSLRAIIAEFQSKRQKVEDRYKRENPNSEITPNTLRIEQCCNDFIHPSYEARIEKMQQALKDRFGVQVD